MANNIDDLRLELLRLDFYSNSLLQPETLAPPTQTKTILHNIRKDIENNIQIDEDISRLKNVLDKQIEEYGEDTIALAIAQAPEEFIGATRQFIYAKAVKGENGTTPKTEEEVRESAFWDFMHILTGTIPTATEVLS